MKKRPPELIKLKTHLKYFADDVLVVDELLRLLDPFVDDFFVSAFFDFESLKGLELLEGNEVKEDEAEAEDIGLEGVGGDNLFTLDFDEFWSEEGHGA